MTWQPIETAPREEVVGARGRFIVGMDADGDVHKTFFTPGHVRGEAWVYMPDEGGLLEWFPVLWVDMPEPLIEKRR